MRSLHVQYIVSLTFCVFDLLLKTPSRALQVGCGSDTLRPVNAASPYHVPRSSAQSKFRQLVGAPPHSVADGDRFCGFEFSHPKADAPPIGFADLGWFVTACSGDFPSPESDRGGIAGCTSSFSPGIA